MMQSWLFPTENDCSWKISLLLQTADPLRNIKISKWSAWSSCHCQATKLNSFCKVGWKTFLPLFLWWSTWKCCCLWSHSFVLLFIIQNYFQLYSLCICLLQRTNKLHNMALFVNLLMLTDLKNATAKFISSRFCPCQWTNLRNYPCPINLVYIMHWVKNCTFEVQLWLCLVIFFSSIQVNEYLQS